MTRLQRALDARVQAYATKWALGDLVQLAETPTSTVWHNGRDRVLKLLTPVGLRDEFAGRIWLEWANGRGAVRLIDSTDDAQLLDFLPGPSAADLKDTDACDAICDVLARFPTSSAPEGLIPLKTRFRDLTKVGTSHRHARNGATLARTLLKTQRKTAPLHGDIHHDNILFDGRNWVAIDPKGLVGDRAYDVANVFLNPICEPYRCLDKTRIRMLSRTFSMRLGLCENRILCFAYVHACLSAGWSLQVGSSAEHALAFADVIHPMAQEAADAIFA